MVSPLNNAHQMRAILTNCLPGPSMQSERLNGSVSSKSSLIPSMGLLCSCCTCWCSNFIPEEACGMQSESSSYVCILVLYICMSRTLYCYHIPIRKLGYFFLWKIRLANISAIEPNAGLLELSSAIIFLIRPSVSSSSW